MSIEARGKIVLDGLDKAITNSKTFLGVLQSLELTYKKNRKEQARIITKMKEQNSAFANATKNSKYFAGAMRDLEKSIAKVGNYTNGYTAGLKKIGTSATKAATSSRKLAVGIKKQETAISRLSKRVRENTKANKGWWQSFGRVAIGFGAAYRAINAFEYAVSELTQTFYSGLSAMDQYIQSTATISGMLALLSTGGSGYKDRFETFHAVMAGTMEETMRILPKYKLSIEEVTDAYKELAQFGVIVTKANVAKTLTSIATIKEIAVTVGSSSKQIRQEIQSLFNGATRVSDQFGRFLKRFPELEEKIYGINKLTTSNVEKWQLAIDVINEYSYAIFRANETVGAQREILKNTLGILSMYSLRGTGLYDKWTKMLTDVNESLIDSKGELQGFGKDVVRYFGAGWQVVNKFGFAIKSIIETQVKNTAGIRAFAAANWDTVAAMLKLSVALKFAGMSFGMLFKIMRSFITIPLVIAGGVLYLRNVLMELDIIKFDSLEKSLEGLLTTFDKLIISGKDFFKVLVTPNTWLDRANKGVAENFFIRKAKVHPDQISTGTDEDILRLADSYIAKLRKIGELNEHAIQLQGKYFIQHAENIRNAVPKIAKAEKKMGAVFTNSTKRTTEDIKKMWDMLVEKVTGLSGDFFTVDWNTKLSLEDAEAAGQALEKTFQQFQFNQAAQFDEIKKKSKETWEYTADGFSTYFTAIVSGEVTSFLDLWKLTLTTMRDTWAQAMSDMASDYINKFMREIAIQSKAEGTGFFATFLKTAFSKIVGGTSSPAAPTTGTTGSGMQMGMVSRMASGGVIPEPVAGIGASGQVYAFAEKGPERVLSNSDSFGGSPSETNLSVEIINKSSQPVRAKQGGTRMDIKGMVTQIILEDKATNGPIARGMA